MLEQRCHRHADCGAQSYCHNSDDGRTFTCKRCAQWNSLRLSTSVTNMVPPACMALERERGIERGPCEELFASACPCSRHGCWRATACTQSVWSEKSSGGDKGTLPGTVSAPATSAAIVTGLFKNESFPLHVEARAEDGNHSERHRESDSKSGLASRGTYKLGTRRQAGAVTIGVAAVSACGQDDTARAYHDL